MQASSLLLPILRSPFQGELLAWLYLHPGVEASLADLARRFGVSQATVSREADRLAQAGLVLERRLGIVRLLRANLDTVVTRPLTDLLAVTYGPMAIITDALMPIEHITGAYIYGSWAARYRGEPGPVPGDVDVVVIGAPDADDLYEAAATAERRLAREVNITAVPESAWQSPAGNPFLESVRTRPLVKLDLTTGVI
ncbi:MarR family transcriptional regulator [Dactylosporangium sp. NPDC005572]|uniref:MarR family transcriptional regulator n=1 Tax=Dactylosporangium sp. NPDC005572 TaxID=3156889 RepID=UPI0033A99A98